MFSLLGVGYEHNESFDFSDAAASLTYSLNASFIFVVQLNWFLYIESGFTASESSF
jgi:hypothetical protein